MVVHPNCGCTGHGINDRNRGWRKAVRFALTENPVSEVLREKHGLPEFFRRATSSQQPTLLEGRLGYDEPDSEIDRPDEAAENEFKT